MNLILENYLDILFIILNLIVIYNSLTTFTIDLVILRMQLVWVVNGLLLSLWVGSMNTLSSVLGYYTTFNTSFRSIIFGLLSH